MAKIHIVPVCGECGHDLSKENNSIEVTFVSEYIEMADGSMLHISTPILSPLRCPKCGAIFSDVAIYPKMPRNTETRVVIEHSKPLKNYL